MKVTILQDFLGAPDHTHVQEYKVGETYTVGMAKMPLDFATGAVANGRAEFVTEDAPPVASEEAALETPVAVEEVPKPRHTRKAPGNGRERPDPGGQEQKQVQK